PPVPVVTSSMTVNYLSPAIIGHWIVGDAQIDRIGGRQAHVSGKIYDGETILMTMTGVFTLMRPKSS
ncbi:MAG: PaaI family thioesterase, partial [Marinomonas sp.]